MKVFGSNNCLFIIFIHKIFVEIKCESSVEHILHVQQPVSTSKVTKHVTTIGPDGKKHTSKTTTDGKGNVIEGEENGEGEEGEESGPGGGGPGGPGGQ